MMQTVNATPSAYHRRACGSRAIRAPQCRSHRHRPAAGTAAPLRRRAHCARPCRIAASRSARACRDDHAREPRRRRSRTAARRKSASAPARHRPCTQSRPSRRAPRFMLEGLAQLLGEPDSSSIGVADSACAQRLDGHLLQVAVVEPQVAAVGDQQLPGAGARRRAGAIDPSGSVPGRCTISVPRAARRSACPCASATVCVKSRARCRGQSR